MLIRGLKIARLQLPSRPVRLRLENPQNAEASPEFFAAPLDALNLRFFRMTNWIQAKSLRALGQPGDSNGRRLTWGWLVGKTVSALRRDREGLSDRPI